MDDFDGTYRQAKTAANKIAKTGRRLARTLLQPQVLEGVEKLITSLWSLRVTLTVFLILWGIGASIAYSWSYKNPTEAQRHKDEIKFIHKIFLGEKPILVILVQLWLFTTIAALLWYSFKELKPQELWKRVKSIKPPANAGIPSFM